MLKSVSIFKLSMVIALCGAVLRAAPNERIRVGLESRDPVAPFVSSLKLLLSPEKYHGQRVRTEGILYTDNHDSFLFIYTEDWRKFRLGNAFALQFTITPTPEVAWGTILHGKDVLIEGTFYAPSGKKGFEVTGGGLARITFVEEVRRAPEPTPPGEPGPR